MSYTARLLKEAMENATDLEVQAGSRRVEYDESGLEFWEYGVVVIGENEEELIELMEGVGRDALQADRHLSDTAIDVRVGVAVGPRPLPDGRPSVEFIVHVQKES